jgi:hypothetical protein
MRVARTFKDFILVAAAVFLVTPLNALMASQRQDTLATTRDGPYCAQRVPRQATRCPYCTSDFEPALVRVEPARAKAGPLERERPRRVSLSTARLQWRDALICAHLCDHPCRVVTPDILAERLQMRVGLNVQIPL